MIVEPDSLNVEAETEVEQEVAQPEIPEKYQGKSLDEIVQMHQNLEKEYSRQGNELGTLRKTTDKLLELETYKPEATAEPVHEELDWDYDTKNAVETTVNSKVSQVDKKLSALEQKLAVDNFKRQHPNFEKDAGSQEFLEWVQESKYRTNLYNRNYNGLDLDAAEELMLAWEDRPQPEQEEQAAQKRKKDLKAASLEKGASGGSSKKIFNRTELINMKIYEPHKYEAMLPEIELAYVEGRVK